MITHAEMKPSSAQSGPYDPYTACGVIGEKGAQRWSCVSDALHCTLTSLIGTTEETTTGAGWIEGPNWLQSAQTPG